MAETRILVVEDEIIIAEDIRSSLVNMGYVVPSIVSSGEMAIEKAEKDNPDLVLMDIILKGGIDGIAAADQIRSRFNIPVVYLTAHGDDNTLEKAKITEPFGYIIKPFKERELQITIELALIKNKMEKKLKESKEWYSATLRSISDAVIATDSEGCVIFMNPVAQFLTGWTLAEARGKPLKDVFNIINGKADNGTESSVVKVAREGVVVDQANQTVLISRDGKKTPIDDYGDPIRDDKGNFIGFVLVFRDIAERKEAEEELIGLKELYEGILEDIVKGIWVTDRNDVVCYANKSMVRVAGTSLRQMYGVRILIDLPESTLGLFRPYYLEAKETLQPIYYKGIPFVTPEGHQSYQSGWLIPRIKDRSYNGMICTVEDIN